MRAGASFQAPLKCLCEQFIWERTYGFQVPKFELVCVNRRLHCAARDVLADRVRSRCKVWSHGIRFAGCYQ